MRITMKLLCCLCIGLLAACASARHVHPSSRAAELHEHYIGGDLYQVGRHIYHHPEWKRPS